MKKKEKDLLSKIVFGILLPFLFFLPACPSNSSQNLGELDISRLEYQEDIKNIREISELKSRLNQIARSTVETLNRWEKQDQITSGSGLGIPEAPVMPFDKQEILKIKADLDEKTGFLAHFWESVPEETIRKIERQFPSNSDCLFMLRRKKTAGEEEFKNFMNSFSAAPQGKVRDCFLHNVDALASQCRVEIEKRIIDERFGAWSEQGQARRDPQIRRYFVYIKVSGIYQNLEDANLPEKIRVNLSQIENRSCGGLPQDDQRRIERIVKSNPNLFMPNFLEERIAVFKGDLTSVPPMSFISPENTDNY